MVTQKEFDAQMDRMNGEEPAEDEPVVIVDEIYLLTIQSENRHLKEENQRLRNEIERMGKIGGAFGDWARKILDK